MLLKAKPNHLNPHVFHHIRQWFLAYVESVYSPDKDCQFHIELKRNHSLRVTALAGLIGKQLGLSLHDVLISKTIGLLHDVARFEQFTRYRTFNDRLSFDHGAFGASLLKELDWFIELEPATQAIITSAISNHNKARIQCGLDGDSLLHTRIIRDADKLDILHITCKNILKNGHHLKVSEKTSETRISEGVLSSLTRAEIVNYDELTSDIDFLLLKAGWVYDFNFLPSVKLLVQRQYIDTIKTSLPDSDPVAKVFSQIESYLKKRVLSL